MQWALQSTVMCLARTSSASHSASAPTREIGDRAIALRAARTDPVLLCSDELGHFTPVLHGGWFHGGDGIGAGGFLYWRPTWSRYPCPLIRARNLHTYRYREVARGSVPASKRTCKCLAVWSSAPMPGFLKVLTQTFGLRHGGFSNLRSVLTTFSSFLDVSRNLAALMQ